MDIEQIADAFWTSMARGIHYPPEWKGRLSTRDAYRVQLAILDRHLQRGERQAGWKVGLTNRAIQDQFGVHEPVMGFLLQSGHRPSDTVIRRAGLIKPGFETELCVTMGASLEGPGVSGEDVRRAIATMAPAFEIIEGRGDFTADLSLSLADNCQQKAFVTGEALALPPGWQLSGTTVEVLINGREVGRATGREDVCDPLAAVAWLANKLADFGRSLDAGMRVMSGSFIPQFPFAPGDRLEARFSPFGAVRASVE
ncbi:MAG TPA: fumarylacetoacetate hydrolase family protein [Methylomirabilota bacterium]|nr:fumarylacetoacetate hydrolase family protein [Methylomirabilota bacterium]